MANEKIAELHIQDEIVLPGMETKTAVSAASFRQQLADLGDFDSLILTINSPGGAVFEGQSIYSMLKNLGKPVDVVIEGLAGSIASVIAMAGRTVTFNDGAMLMIHKPASIALGNADDMRKTADTLDSLQKSIVAVYQAKTSLDTTKLNNLIDQETWLTADEAVNFHFGDKINRTQAVFNAIPKDILSSFNNVPKQFMAADEASSQTGKETPTAESNSGKQNAQDSFDRTPDKLLLEKSDLIADRLKEIFKNG